jgi:hypothetical protein
VIRAAALLLLLAQAAGAAAYSDPQRRFRFTYPRSFGATSPGTNDGFQGRAAAVRFASFPAQLGGELALTRGVPTVDIQAAGGLYDSIALEALPDSLRASVSSALPVLSERSFCDIIARESHLDVTTPWLVALSSNQRDAVIRLDSMRNNAPRLLRCELANGVIVFDKETSFDRGWPRQHVFGAIRFLTGQYSTVQLIAGGGAPASGLLDEMADVLRSFVVSR